MAKGSKGSKSSKAAKSVFQPVPSSGRPTTAGKVIGKGNKGRG